MKLLRNDTVLVRSGKDVGKKGKILQVFPHERLVVVEGVNKIVRHLRPQKRGESGQKLEVDGPIPMANVALICPSCGKPTRVGFGFQGTGKDKKKVRICHKCSKTVVPKPLEKKKETKG